MRMPPHPDTVDDRRRGMLSHKDAQEHLLLLLEHCQITLNDWLHTYVHERCVVNQIPASIQRISQHGGTLAYIAHMLDRLNHADIVSIAAIPTVEQSSLHALDKSEEPPSSIGAVSHAIPWLPLYMPWCTGLLRQMYEM